SGGRYLDWHLLEVESHASGNCCYAPCLPLFSEQSPSRAPAVTGRRTPAARQAPPPALIPLRLMQPQAAPLAARWLIWWCSRARTLAGRKRIGYCTRFSTTAALSSAPIVPCKLAQS